MGTMGRARGPHSKSPAGLLVAHALGHLPLLRLLHKAQPACALVCEPAPLFCSTMLMHPWSSYLHLLPLSNIGMLLCRSSQLGKRM